MVPMLTCGFVRSNFAFATCVSSWTVLVLFKAVLIFQLWPRQAGGPAVPDPSPSRRSWLASGPAPSLGADAPRFSLTRRLRAGHGSPPGQLRASALTRLDSH